MKIGCGIDRAHAVATRHLRYGHSRVDVRDNRRSIQSYEMQNVPVALLLAIVLFVSLAMAHSQAEGAASVNGHIEPRGTMHTGDNATLVLEFSTSPVLGGEYVDEEGKFKFDIHATLRLDGLTSLKPIPSGGGYFIKPEAAEVPIRVKFNHPLTAGKWIVNATIYQQMNHTLTPVDINPDTWEFDVIERPPPDKTWWQLAYENSATLPVAIGGGVAVAVVLFLLRIGKAKNDRRQGDGEVPARRADEQIERGRDLQHVRDDMTALPRAHLRNLERQYRRMKKNGKAAIFSEGMTVLRNQADTVEATLDNVAGIVLDKLQGHPEFDGFAKQYGARFLYAWALCKEDVEGATGPINQNAGTRFKELGEKLAQESGSLPDPNMEEETEEE